MFFRPGAWLAVLLSSLALAQPVQAQIASGGAITVVVPIGAGGGVDADDKQFGQVIRTDHERFGKIIRDAGIQPN